MFLRECFILDHQKMKSNIYAIHAGFNGDKKFFESLDAKPRKQQFDTQGSEELDVSSEWKRLAMFMKTVR